MGTTEPPTRSARGPRPTCGRARAATQERKLLAQLVQIAQLAQIHLLVQIAQMHCQHNLNWLFSLYSRACTTLYCLHCLHELPPAHLVVLKSALIITGAQFTRHKKQKHRKAMQGAHLVVMESRAFYQIPCRKKEVVGIVSFWTSQVLQNSFTE